MQTFEADRPVHKTHMIIDILVHGSQIWTCSECRTSKQFTTTW